MNTLGMNGPLDLNAMKISEAIKAKSPGNYALGYINEHTFMVQYVGRSDSNIHHSLNTWVGKYPKFKWSYAMSEKEAYDKECQNFHDFGGAESLDNEIHPAKPEGMDWKCLVCGI